MTQAATKNVDVKGSRPRARRGVLDNLPTRQRLTGDQAAARSQIVRKLRIALPILAVVLIGALLVNTQSGSGDDAFLDDFANLDATPEELRMANPRFAGVDDKGHPYEITAEAALQASGVQDLVDLVNPRAVTRGVDSNTIVSADKGLFRSKENILDLSDSVIVNHSIGGEAYVLKTPAATVSIGEETVQSTTGIEGESESGRLRADTMRAYNSEGRVVFEGNVSMRIFPKKAKFVEPDKIEPTDNDSDQGGP